MKKILIFVSGSFALAVALFYLSAPQALASTNISSVSPDYYAWNDNIGWVDFYSTGNVEVTSTGLSGYATSTNGYGYIALDCHTTPGSPSNICSTSNFQVVNDGSGNLAGWAWNDQFGWISFCGNASGGSTWNGSTWVCPASPTYQVKVDLNGDFSGWAWNDNVGWFSFNCTNTSSCGTVSYKVNNTWSVAASGWLISSTFDAGAEVAFNSILWNGTQPTGTDVKLQLATANCSNGATDPPACATNVGWGGSKTSGDGAFIGPDGTSATYYAPVGPGTPAPITTYYANNKRYYEYEATLEKGTNTTSTPTVTGVVVNWSP
ncbi:MAG TPA: hypothetical protein VMU70_00695 [Candidatus Tyrphobacter sp.]|nr:hypothetical protein [Candidatus Tyrphobacter sp.]